MPTALVDVVARFLAPAFALVLVLALLTAGAMLLHPQGRKVANLLALLAGTALAATTRLLLDAARSSGDPRHAVGVTGLLGLGYLGLMFVVHLLAAVLYARTTRPREVDYVIVLGAGLLGSGVTRLLASRLDTALELLRSRCWNPHGAVQVIVSGGRGADELVTEARAMATYLTEHGVRPGDVLLEERATTTKENLRHSRAIIAGRGAGARAVVVTNDFHVLRAALVSRRLGIDASAVGAWTPWYYLPRAVLREFAAVLVVNVRAHAVVGVALAVAGIAT